MLSCGVFQYNAYRLLGLSASASLTDTYAAEAAVTHSFASSEVSRKTLDHFESVDRYNGAISSAIEVLENSDSRIAHRLLWFHDLDYTKKVAPARSELNARWHPFSTHDRVLRGLIDAYSAVDMVQIVLSLHDWHDLVKDRGYWKSLRRIEKSGGFDRPANRGQITELRARAMQMAANPFILLAKSTLDQGRGPCLSDYLEVLHQLEDTGPWVADCRNEILSSARGSVPEGVAAPPHARTQRFETSSRYLFPIPPFCLRMFHIGYLLAKIRAAEEGHLWGMAICVALVFLVLGRLALTPTLASTIASVIPASPTRALHLNSDALHSDSPFAASRPDRRAVHPSLNSDLGQEHPLSLREMNRHHSSSQPAALNSAELEEQLKAFPSQYRVMEREIAALQAQADASGGRHEASDGLAAMQARHIRTQLLAREQRLLAQWQRDADAYQKISQLAADARSSRTEAGPQQ